MKKSLKLFAIAMLCVFVFTGCEKEKTMQELLTIEKGWVMTAATTVPYWTLNNGTQIEDLFNDGYFFDYEKDDIIIFKNDGYQYWNPGKLVEEGQPTSETSLGKWELDEANKELKMQLPFFYDTDVETVQIAELTSERMKLQYTYTLAPDAAKGVPGTYTYTLIYVPAK